MINEQIERWKNENGWYSTATVRKRAAQLAERCGCRTWRAHRGVAIWQLEEEGKIK